MEAAADNLAEAFDPGGALRPYPPLEPEEWLEQPVVGAGAPVRVGVCRFPKPRGEGGDDAARAARSTRDLYLLQQLLTKPEVEEIRSLAEALSYDDPRVEPVDGRPARMSSVIRAGDYVCGPAIEAALRPIVESKLLPFARRHFGWREAVPCTCFLRRYAAPEGRPCLQAHFDGNAVVTINVGITEEAEFAGGMYVQPTADAASRVQVPLGKGDVLMHSYDLLHGVTVVRGVRHSLILWLRESAASCTSDACPWYAGDAALGDADAQLNLAEHHRAGTGGAAQDLEMAASLYERAARQGHPIAQFKLGILREREDGDARAALPWWRLAAEQGYAKAQRRLAEHEEPGRWLRAAARQDDYLAMYELYRRLGENGGAELEGGSEREPADALVWLVRAARYGHAPAQFELGARVLDLAADAAAAAANSGTPAPGPSVASLLAAGLGWFLRAGEGGDKRAQALLAGILARSFSGRAGLERALLAYSRISAGRPPDRGAELADVAWAAGACSFPPALGMALRGLQAQSPGSAWPLEALVCVAWACARCDLRDEAVLGIIAGALVDAGQELGEAQPQQLSTLLWSLATLSARVPEAALEALLPVLPARLAGLAAPALARLGWALAALLGARAPQDVREALAFEAARRRRELCAEDLANLAWGAARLGAGQACADRLLEAAGERAEEFGLNELANLAWALAEMGADAASQAGRAAVERLAAAAQRLGVAKAAAEAEEEEAAALRARLRAALGRLAGDGDGMEAKALVFSICWSDRCGGAKAALQALLAEKQSSGREIPA